MGGLGGARVDWVVVAMFAKAGALLPHSKVGLATLPSSGQALKVAATGLLE